MMSGKINKVGRITKNLGQSMFSQTKKYKEVCYTQTSLYLHQYTY